MALEDKIDALIAALKENTAALGASAKLREEAMTMVKSATGSETAKEEKKAAAKEEKKQVEEKTDADVDVYAGLKELIADYLAVERPEERKARQTKVINLLNHEKIKKPDLPADAKPDTQNIAPGSIDLFKKQMQLLKEKGDLTTPAEDALV